MKRTAISILSFVLAIAAIAPVAQARDYPACEDVKGFFDRLRCENREKDQNTLDEARNQHLDIQ
ncbi:MAG: hypothetical protein QNJ46_24260 [Leptolyngbyaceae cyanobacterium MO_188.B28]|nr:hypothetical protein [Leptolyngbyaceae cyanobacterium MO_188.B28]